MTKSFIYGGAILDDGTARIYSLAASEANLDNFELADSPAATICTCTATSAVPRTTGAAPRFRAVRATASAAA